MTERFNVVGRAAGQALRPPRRGGRAFADKAGRVRDIGVRIAMSNRVFFTALTLVAVAGHRAGLRRRRHPRHRRHPQGRHPGRAGRPARPALRPAHRAVQRAGRRDDRAGQSFERVFEVLDLPPMVDEKPDAVTLPPGPHSVEFDHVAFRYPTRRRGVAGVARVGGRARLRADPAGAARRLVHRRARPAGRARRALRRRQDHDHGAGRAALRRHRRRRPDRRHDVRDVTLESLHDVVGSSPRTPTCSTTRSAPTCSTPPRGAPEAELVAALPGRPDLDLVASLPDGLDTVVGSRGHRRRCRARRAATGRGPRSGRPGRRPRARPRAHRGGVEEVAADRLVEHVRVLGDDAHRRRAGTRG